MAVKLSLWNKSPNACPLSASPRNGSGLHLPGTNRSSLILIHGLTGTPNEMKHLAGFFNKKGFSVVCPRLANHGHPIEVLKRTTWQQCYDSVRKAFLKVRSGSGARETVFVAGLSMGALLALLLADEFGNGVAAVSCLSPTLFYDGWNVPWLRHLLPLVSNTPLKYCLYFKEQPPYGIKNQKIRQRIDRSFRSASLDDLESIAQFGYPYFPVSLLCEVQLLVKHLTQRLASIRVPVQIVQAKEDDMTSVRNAQFIYERVASREKEIVLLEDSYHIVTADQERTKVARRMSEFFGKIAAPRLVEECR